MFDKDLCLKMRQQGYAIEDIARKCKALDTEVYDFLKSSLGDKFLELNLNFDENEIRVQDILFSRLGELVSEYYPDYKFPVTKEKYLIITKDVIGTNNIGINIRATYYDSVIKSLWVYKKYNLKVDKLYIIIVSRRLTGEKIKAMQENENKPENVILIDYRNKEDIIAFYNKLWAKLKA
ncbi:MAG: hypothetical protein K0B02_03295 [DPANN group archaeon]|nr:hypothetical protein [DPANN group archaeon]